jgi:hypothetical protein
MSTYRSSTVMLYTNTFGPSVFNRENAGRVRMYEYAFLHKNCARKYTATERERKKCINQRIRSRENAPFFRCLFSKLLRAP